MVEGGVVVMSTDEFADLLEEAIVWSGGDPGEVMRAELAQDALVDAYTMAVGEIARLRGEA